MLTFHSRRIMNGFSNKKSKLKWTVNGRKKKTQIAIHKPVFKDNFCPFVTHYLLKLVVKHATKQINKDKY